METNAIIYARVSSVGERQSTERQVSDLRRYAEYSGFRIMRIFEEKISGAKKNLERPVLLKLLNMQKTITSGIYSYQNYQDSEEMLLRSCLP